MKIADIGKVLAAERALYVMIQCALQTSGTKGLGIGGES